MDSRPVLDVVIVGGGPIGLACGLEAKKAGLNYLIIEKGTLVNSIYNYPVNMGFFSTSERLEIGGIPFVSTHAKPGRNEALEYYRRVAIAGGIQVRLFERVITTKKEDDHYIITTSKGSYAARNIIIATGFYDIPYLLNVKGEELPKVKHYYDDPHYYAFQKVVVVGAANSAVDAALETWRKGAEVTMVVKGEEISNRVKYWVKPDIENRIKEGSIQAYFSSAITEIRENEVDIQTPAGPVTIANDWVLAMTGYQPDLSFLEKLGIELSDDEVRKPAYNEDTHETNVAGIYLAGVICGGMNTHRLFIENSREHAEKIIANIVKQ
ncbi:YpdA family putative bacillithiol disulfide reductase [Aridibaculum aurantiacum]|uniref:YpdA family putative bacillithiol disulfide reductase n=1 Tax=Aridibaculum aurantiacum TaxID=2810307 RepID=UPI001A965808|nr:YpdA family putative bacillithiol disulfide reductase [Aridibaculum aurantiacum]